MGGTRVDATDGDLFRAIFENSSEGIAVIDRSGRYLAANQVYCDMLGYPQEELLELSVFDVITKEDQQRQPIRLERPVVGQPLTLTRVLERKDGTTFTAEISSFSLPDGRLVGFHRDITARINAAELVRQQRDLGLQLAGAATLADTLKICLQFAIVTAGMDGGAIFLADQTGDFVLANRIGIPEDSAGMPARLRRDTAPGRSLADGTPLYGNHRMLADRRPSNPDAPQPKALALVPITREREVIAVLAVTSFRLEEVSPTARSTLEAVSMQLGQAIARARLEAELREQRARLAHEVEERTKALSAANARLQEVVAGHEQTLAERARLIAELEAKNSEMERFIYTVSHDLRTPVITIKGFVGLMEADLEEGNIDSLLPDLRRIGDAAARMQRLLDDLIEFSRVGRINGPSEKVSISTLARDALVSLGGQVRTDGVRIHIEEDMPPVWGDRKRLMEVMENLLRNALMFMGDQETPEVRVGARSENGETVYFVQDNGIGIASQYHERVFGLFERLDSGQDGTGVGLTITRRVIEHHGGRIWIESAGDRRGTTVCFTIPSTQ